MTSSVEPSPLTWTLHLISGVVAQVPSHLLDHALFGEQLVEVEPFTKSYDSKMWKPTTKDEYSKRIAKAKAEAKDEDKK